jgi:hypothetical protein
MENAVWIPRHRIHHNVEKEWAIVGIVPHATNGAENGRSSNVAKPSLVGRSFDLAQWKKVIGKTQKAYPTQLAVAGIWEGIPDPAARNNEEIEEPMYPW